MPGDLKVKMDLFFHSILIVWLFFLLVSDFANCSCMQQLSLELSSQYSGYAVSQGVKTSTTAPSQAECITYCVNSGDKKSMIYNPNTMACSCHNLPLSSLTMSPQPGAIALGVPGENPSSDTVVLWIASILGQSSHYSTFLTNYPSTRMIGPADFYPSYGNDQNAWCPGSRNADQWVEFAISEFIYITEVHIYEVFFAGGVESLSIRDPNSNWIEIWRTPGLEIITESRIFSPNFISPNFKARDLRIDLDLGTTNVWSEFDAVRVIGTRTRNRTAL